MACENLESIVKSCSNNSGGIFKVYINQQDNIDDIVLGTAPNSWTIVDINLIVGGDLYTEFEIRRNTGSYTEDAAIDLVNGSSYVTATISLMFHRRDQSKSQAIKVLGAGQQYLNAIIQDANGLYWYFPYLQLSAVGEGSGTARADGSKYSVTLISENDFLCYQVDPTIVPALIA
jgi:hypothetical protein